MSESTLEERMTAVEEAVRDLQEKGEGKSAEDLVKLVLKRMAAGR